MNKKIKVFWGKKDYIKGPWRINKSPTSRFKAKVKKFNHDNVQVYINNNVPKKFFQLIKKFKLKSTVLALNKMTPGQILPFHTDKYLTYCKRNKIKNKNKIKRIIVFLEDSQPGHQLWIKNKFCTGSAGSYFSWLGQTKHMAANLGEKNRYTLQITGLIN